MNRLLLVGLDEPEYLELKARVAMPILFHPGLPAIRLEQGRLLVEDPDLADRFVRVSHVIFHGIFEDDFDFITALALWAGPCLPAARGLLDGRLRLPCLARALQVSRFGSMARGFGLPGQTVRATGESVAKWGNWHCGENKVRFTESFTCTEASVIEPFIPGASVRVVLIGDAVFQVRLAGETWLQSIHHQGAAFMPEDPALVEDTRALAAHFGLEMVGVDYQIAADGTRHLLELNHIPNVTVFPEIRAAFMDLAARWLAGPKDPPKARP